MTKALRSAAFNGDIEQFRLLLPIATPVQKSLLLKSAIESGLARIVDDLIHDGVPLHLNAIVDAARRNNEQVVRILVNRGCDINATGDNEMTALMYAAKYGAESILLCLLNANADVNLVDRKGHSALYYALVGNEDGMVQLLMDAGAQGHGLEEVLSQTVQRGDIEKARHLLKIGANPNGSMQSVPIIVAAKQGYLEMVQALAEAGADVNRTHAPGSRTALHYALQANNREISLYLLQAGAVSPRLPVSVIREGDLELLKHFLRNGLHPNDPSNGMLLVAAAKAGNEAIVEALINAGADVNLRHPGCRTALMHAAELGMTKTVERLLAAGAHVNATLDKGHTALMWACSEGHAEVVRLLLDAGANIEIRNGANMTALSNTSKSKYDNQLQLQTMIAQADAENTFRSADKSYFPIAEEFETNGSTWMEINQLLLEKKERKSKIIQGIFPRTVNINQTDIYNRTILMYAAYYGYAAIVNLLVDRGAVVDSIDNNGLSALTWATNGGNMDVVLLLIARKASMNLSDNRMRTPLHHAIRGRDHEMVKLLLANGGTLYSSKQLEGALVWAAQYANNPLLSEVLRISACIKETDSSGGSALMWAASTGNVQCVETLLNAGASTDDRDVHQKTAMWYAIDKDHADVLEMLIQRGASTDDIDRGDPALCSVSRLGKTKLLERLLKYHVDPNSASMDGTTALMYACRNGHTDVAERLLESGAKVNISNNEGNTALFEAAFADSTPLIEMLMQNGANIEFTNKTGKTPLLAAAAYGNPTAVRALLDRGADMYKKDSSQRDFVKVAEVNEDKGERVAQALVDFHEEKQKKEETQKCKPKGKKRGRKRKREPSTLDEKE